MSFRHLTTADKRCVFSGCCSRGTVRIYVLARRKARLYSFPCAYLRLVAPWKRRLGRFGFDLTESMTEITCACSVNSVSLEVVIESYGAYAKTRRGSGRELESSIEGCCGLSRLLHINYRRFAVHIVESTPYSEKGTSLRQVN